MQSFVLVGEIGADVPESFTCFQGNEGDIGCNLNSELTARFGATRISINDNDGRFDMYVLSSYNFVSTLFIARLSLLLLCTLQL